MCSGKEDSSLNAVNRELGWSIWSCGFSKEKAAKYWQFWKVPHNSRVFINGKRYLTFGGVSPLNHLVVYILGQPVWPFLIHFAPVTVRLPVVASIILNNMFLHLHLLTLKCPLIFYHQQQTCKHFIPPSRGWLWFLLVEDRHNFAIPTRIHNWNLFQSLCISPQTSPLPGFQRQLRTRNRMSQITSSINSYISYAHHPVQFSRG